MKIFENFEFQNYKFLEEDGSRGDLGKSPNGILGVVQGPSLFLNGYSRNGRFYPAEAWENSIKENNFKSKLERGLVFGCIGHPENYTLDELLASGKVSHKVTEIKIDKKTGKGIATYEILDTPAGRILNTVLRSGSKLYVSTRAFGSFKENETVEKDGKRFKVIDPKDFKLESIDFVIEPGFLETDPKLIESMKEDLQKVVDVSDGITCKDGLCGLTSLREKLENQEDNASEEKFKKLEKLDKNSLIEMIKNISKENIDLRKSITEGSYHDFKNTIDTNNTVTNTSDEPEDIDTDDKKLKIKNLDLFLAYLELLLRAIKWNEKYSKNYEKLISYMEKNELKENDLNKIKEILNNILSIEDIDDSVKEIIGKMLNTELKFENLKSMYINTIEKFQERIIEFFSENEKLEEEVNRKEKIIETLKIGLENISEKMELKESSSTNFNEKEYYDLNRKMKIIKEEKEELEESFDDLKETNETLKKALREIKEALREKNKELLKIENKDKDIKEKLVSIEEKYKKEIKEKDKKISLLNKNIKESKIKYYKTIYSLDESEIKDIVEKYSDEKTIQEQLKIKEKFYKQNTKYIESKEEVIGNRNIRNKSLLAEKLI